MMARTIIIYQTVDAPTADNPKTEGDRWLRGHVLDLKPGDWTPGTAEKGNPHFGFLESDQEMIDLLHLIEDPPKNPDGTLPERRLHKLDLDALAKESGRIDKIDGKLGAVSVLDAAAIDAITETRGEVKLKGRRRG